MKISLPNEGIILGIESSCDETSAAILRGRDIASVIISSQHFHTSFGGVVPELASRAHIRSIVPIAEEALAKAGVSAHDITAIAATFAPGLMGALLVGLNFAKGMALSLSVPLIGVHHIEAHIFSAMLEEEKPELPFLALVVSGGHTLLVVVEDIGRYSVIGKTLDDAAGEAFDKVGKMLGMGYPAGPVIDRAAKSGDPTFVKFPRSMMNDETFDFSFSGIKTSVLYYLRDNPGILSTRSADIAASFQQAVVDVLVGKTIRAARERNIRDIVCVGGVSANSLLRSQFKTTCDEQKKRFFSPRPMLSTDNAAMIAMLGALKLDRGISSDLSLSAMARVPL
ncbi:MAG: tRNA (adenosine(37)-N6)-threonylcarbamoyltransferase complex transferase subunit TsaD [Bacteroidota bacterium]|nr:tRNA (adenosine(37)-N6)-threonylcarbamoyltransferase complex transferase subunit TsaD [Bacteroidota bacterium]MDP4234947.1 tRNA (adenosine(37)-N6)-threonylcarbamoyltransferase complex transferase subunit TsaD [Bacteroidota bacterium]